MNFGTVHNYYLVASRLFTARDLILRLQQHKQWTLLVLDARFTMSPVPPPFLKKHNKAKNPKPRKQTNKSQTTQKATTTKHGKE